MLKTFAALTLLALVAVGCASGPAADPCADLAFKTPACTPPDAPAAAD